MKILRSYLKSVKVYLQGNQKDDIINELYENILSQMNEKEEEIGRALTDTEQINILKNFGEPIDIAKQYNKNEMTLSFGKKLIGPEIFPRYILLLLVNLAITSSIVILAAVSGLPLNIPMIMLSLFIQFVCISLVFIFLERIKRKYPEPWLFPPISISTLFPVPRWQMYLGIILWGPFTLYWLILPLMPSALFGTAAGNLQFTNGWLSMFYLPVAILLLAGLVQRIINYIHPQKTLLLPIIRFFINIFGLIIQFLMIKSYPFIVSAGNLKGQEHYNKLASLYNNCIFGGILSWLWVYILISLIIYSIVIYYHIKRRAAEKKLSLSMTN